LFTTDVNRESQSKKVAYAFIDEGCYGERGLDVLMSSIKKNAKVYYLDSIGAEAALNVVDKQLDKNKINYIFCADINKNKEFYLDKSKLNKKSLNLENFNQTIKLLNQKIKGD
jgi:hypothetical protein